MNALQEQLNPYEFLDEIVLRRLQEKFVSEILIGYESAALSSISIKDSALAFYSEDFYDEYLVHFGGAQDILMKSIGEELTEKPYEELTEADRDDVETLYVEKFYYYDHLFDKAILNTLQHFSLFFLVVDNPYQNDANIDIDYSRMKEYNSPLQDVW